MRRVAGGGPVLGLGGLVVAAVLGAAAVVGYVLGPVDQDTFVYSYRPADSGVTSGVAVAPLAMARTAPDAVDLTLPCEEPGSTFWSINLFMWASQVGAQQSPLVYPRLGHGFSVLTDEREAVLSLDGSVVGRVPVVGGPGCVVDVGYRDGVWRVVAGDEELVVTDDGPRFAEAAFAGPAAVSAVSAVRVETRELGSSPTPVQLVLLGLVVLLLVVVGREIVVRGARRGGGGESGRGSLLGRVLGGVGLVDVGVVAALLLWILIIPAGIDDGWAVAMQRGYPDYGDFSTVYVNGAAPIPVGYWLNWVQGLWLGLSGTVLVIRVSVLLIGVGTWMGLRSVARSFGVPGGGGSLWLMGAVFVVGYGAWGTLRPEAAVAALLVASLALALRFVRGERGWVVVAWVLVIGLGVTAHPAGMMVAAPALVSWRSIWGWARSNREAAYVASAALVMLATVTLLLMFFDSNLTTKLESIKIARVGGHDLSIASEMSRYQLLDASPYGTVLRRVSVGLMLVGVGAFLVRSRRRWSGVQSLPGRALLVGLVLLALTPSKWPWHFGGLLALVALVVAVELRRVDAGPPPAGDSVRARGTAVMRMVAVMAGTAVVMAWAWSGSLPWTALDLRTQRWWKGAVNLLPVDLSSIATWIGIALVSWGGVAVYRRWRSESRTWSPPEVLAIVSAVVVVGYTASMLLVDVVRTDGWTFGRQNLESVIGRSTCGLGDEIIVPVPGSLHSLSPVGGVSVAADRAAADAGFDGGGLFERGGFPTAMPNTVRPLRGMDDVGSWVAVSGDSPEANTGSYRSQWHAIDPGDDTVVLMVMGLYGEGSGNDVGVQWGAATESGVEDLGIDYGGLSGYFTDWSMVSFDVSPHADRVRLLLGDDTIGNAAAWVAASHPLAASTTTITKVGSNGTSEIAVVPPLLLYLPCVDVPAIEDSVVPPPGLMVLRAMSVPGQATWPPSAKTSTFMVAAASERYFRLPVAISPVEASDEVLLLVSQEYLTGDPARATGYFRLEDL